MSLVTKAVALCGGAIACASKVGVEIWYTITKSEEAPSFHGGVSLTLHLKVSGKKKIETLRRAERWLYAANEGS